MGGDVDSAVVEALEGYQQRTLRLLNEHDGDPEAGIKALVGLHLEWTEEDADRAKMVSRNRNEVMAGPLGPRLSESNREWFGKMKRWIDSQAEAGLIAPVSFNLLHAVIFAPTQEIAKLWLAGLLKRPLSTYAEALGDAAWAGLRALPPRS